MTGNASTSASSPPAGLLTSLQAGRAIAALLVILYHNGAYIFALDKYWGHDPSGHLFNFAHAGVEFFFVLSGFIILHIHWRDIDQPARLGNYAKKRFLRIYQLFWLVLAVIIPIYFIVPSFGHPFHREFSTILSSVTLIFLSNNDRTELAVAWTLYHEVLFYAFFALLIINRRIGSIALGLWFITSVYALTLAEPLPAPFAYLTSPLHLLFGMGMFACWLLHRRRIVAPSVLASTGIILFIAVGLEEDYVKYCSEDIRNICFGFASTLALIGLVALEQQNRLKVPALLTLIGNASYVIYLTHFTVLSLLAKIFIHVGAREMLPIWLCYLLLPALTIAFGILIHLAIEQPLLRLLNRKHINQSLPLTTAPSFT